MIINSTDLSPQALLGVVDNFILREGTDYGSQEMAYEKKREALLQKIKNGDAFIAFDAETESVTIISKDEAQDWQR